MRPRAANREAAWAFPGHRDHRHLSYDYTAYAGRDWRFFEDLFLQTGFLPPVLDVGTGLGLFLECCRRHNTLVVGIELSEEGIVACARQRLPVVRGDITAPLPFRDGSFGSIFVHHVLEHISSNVEEGLLREILRVLRPGGFVLVVSPNVHHPDARRQPNHVNLSTPHGLQRKLLSAGFSRVSLKMNYWRPIWDRRIHLGVLSSALTGILWKVAPIDRFAWNSSAMAWK